MKSLIKKSPKKEHDPDADYFPFSKRMAAPGREQNLLGCAFAYPLKGTLGPWTPQGDMKVRNEKADPQQTDPPTVAGAAAEASTPITRSVPVGYGTQAQTQSSIRYDTLGRWPRDLTDRELYPNIPAIAMGVEAIQERYHNAGVGITILDALKSLFHLEKHQLETIEIPYFRRYDIEDPEGKIKNLLTVDEYRSRLIHLFNEQINKGFKPLLYIATGIIACGKMSIGKVKENSVEMEATGSDPIDTVPVKVDGNWHYIRKSSVSGTYEGDVIFAMAYHQIRYECIPTETKTLIWDTLRGIFSKDAAPKERDIKLDKRADMFESKVEGHRDAFWVDVHSTKGGFEPWFSEADDAEKENGRERTTGDNDLEEVQIRIDSANDGLEYDTYPSGFFVELSLEGIEEEVN